MFVCLFVFLILFYFYFYLFFYCFLFPSLNVKKENNYFSLPLFYYCYYYYKKFNVKIKKIIIHKKCSATPKLKEITNQTLLPLCYERIDSCINDHDVLRVMDAQIWRTAREVRVALGYSFHMISRPIRLAPCDMATAKSLKNHCKTDFSSFETVT